MRYKALMSAVITMLIVSCGSDTPDTFAIDDDLLLVQYDCKTDVDDLHSAAAFATLLADSRFSDINYRAVAGAYGTQQGLYVPPGELFDLAFGDRWSDAHSNLSAAVKEVAGIAKSTLAEQGDVWIAEAGQSDFSARVVKAIRADIPDINTKNRIHIVQHSDWNEEVTSPQNLRFVKQHTNYQKIADGNAAGNGTPNFRSPEAVNIKEFVSDSQVLSIWERAIALANTYNGKEGRYMNEAIQSGGLDFSDFSEVCWILGMDEIKNADDFFNAVE